MEVHEGPEGIVIQPDPAVMFPRGTVGGEFSGMEYKYQVLDEQKRLRYRGDNVNKAAGHVRAARDETGRAYLQLHSEEIMAQFDASESIRASRMLVIFDREPAPSTLGSRILNVVRRFLGGT